MTDIELAEEMTESYNDVEQIRKSHDRRAPRRSASYTSSVGCLTVGLLVEQWLLIGPNCPKCSLRLMTELICRQSWHSISWLLCLWTMIGLL